MIETQLKQQLKTYQDNPLSETEIQAFAHDLNQLKAEIMGKMGDEDVIYVETVHQAARLLEITGRLLLHFSLEPVGWSLGVLSLWAYLQLDNLEIHHHAQHGAWDPLPKAEPFHSANYYHNSPVDEEAWRYRHNILHHSYTGQVDRDPDVTYGIFRLSELIDKEFFHTVQPGLLVINTLMSADSLGMLSAGMYDFFNQWLIPGYKKDNHVAMFEKMDLPQFFQSIWKYSRKSVPHNLYNFGLYGALAGPLFWGKVTLGTLTAMLIRNIFTGLTFYTGHMVEGVKHYEQGPNNRAEWYVQQIEGTANVRANRLVSLLMGHLNYQIEHHLFPKLPPNRLEEIAPKVEALCKQYGVRYNTGGFFEQVSSVFKRVQQFSK